MRPIDADWLKTNLEDDANVYAVVTEGILARTVTPSIAYREVMEFIDSAPTLEMKQDSVKFKESDFTEDELKLLRAIFSGADAVVQSIRTDNYDTSMSNRLFYLTQKLGIDEIID